MALPRRLCLPPVISWYLLPVGASSSYDAVHLPRESHRGGVSLMVPLRCNDAVLRSVIGNLFINELGSATWAVHDKSPFSSFAPPLFLSFSFDAFSSLLNVVYCLPRRSN